MTHGEEPGSETHQDSAVLTYLEGLLMHPVAGGPGATATRRSEGGHGNPQEQGNKAVRAHQPPNIGGKPEERRGPPTGATQNLKKARLLRSEAWREPESQRGPASAGDLNGQSRDCHTGAGPLNGSPQGERTMLASLLQSFSSRLQSVAMSQQGTHDAKGQEAPAGKAVQADKEALQCYGTASSRLKGLMKKSKLQNHNSVPYHRRTSQERLSKSPGMTQGAAQPAASDSCAARLKAVANMVKIRSSPAPSPKPSVACSQLALLLSSEAHLQEYSREQALKAQLSARSASERLAAMATQKTQDKKLPNIGQPQMAPDMLSSLNAQKGTLLQPALDSSKQSQTLIPGQSKTVSSPRTPHPFREKRPFDKHNPRPSQNCSSLLLLLLNNHNPQGPINGSGHLDEDFGTFPSRHASPLLSDSEYSNHENSHAKDSSDAESSYSSCSPIDLSVKSRARGSVPGSSSSSLDKLTESLINRWKPGTPGPQVNESKELANSPDVKSHHEVTLMQLLLDHKNNEKVNKIADNPDLRHDITVKPGSAPAGRLTPTAVCEETRSPPGGLVGRNLHPLPTFPRGRDANGTASPYTLLSSPQVQSSPLDLCKSKSCSGEDVHEPAFSASKLLQNLAQCGLQNSPPSPPLKAPMPPSKRHSHELELDKPMTLLERLNAPVQRNRTPILERSNVNCVPFVPESPPPTSEIENLLERRTVLQLLLGTATHKEQPSSKWNGAASASKGSSESQPDKSPVCDSPSGPLLDIKIKTEPQEEGHMSDSYEEAERCQAEYRGCERLSPVSAPWRDVKAESSSTEAIPKDGLLSQLLKQRTRAYHADTQTDLHAGSVKEERGEHQGLSLPKKRKLCIGLEDRLINDAYVRTVERTSHQDTSNGRSIPGTPERRKPASPPEAHPPIRRPESQSPPRDGRGFNVLKQLLLSDNCLKDLSHPRSSSSPSSTQAGYRANGNIANKPGYGHELLNSQWSPGPLGAGPAELRMATTASACSSAPGSPWGSHAPLQESPKLSLVPVKREPEGPIRWTISGEEKQDSRPDSPRLTKSNPILYYMLQKGYTHPRREVREQGDIERSGSKVKEEPIVADHRLGWKRHSPSKNGMEGHESERLNGTLDKW